VAGALPPALSFRQNDDIEMVTDTRGNLFVLAPISEGLIANIDG